MRHITSEGILELLDTNAAAKFTGLARQTLAKIRVAGGGAPYLKLGARVFYPKHELEEWVRSHPLKRSTSETVVVELRT